MKNSWENEQKLIAALELDKVPQAVDDKLQALYAELPDRVPTKEKRGMRKGVKRLLTAASAVAAAFVVLVCGMAVNPALAESIPFFSSLFERIENRSGWKNSEQTLLNLEKYAQTLEDVTVTVPAAGVSEKPLTISAEEYYYDGTFLYIGLSAQIDSTAQQLYFRTFSSGGYNLLINGEELGHFEEQKGVVYEDDSFELDTCFLEKIGSGRYIGKRGQVLPERFRNQEELSVTLRFSGLYGGRALESTYNSSPIELSFTVQKNDAPVLVFDGNGLETGGVVLGSGVATPGGILLTIDRSEQYNNPACNMTFEDGGVIGPVGYSDPETSLGNGFVRRTLICGGYAEDEERRLLVSVFDKNGADDYVAVFLIDPRTGGVELGSADDIVQFTSRLYLCSDEEIAKSEEQHLIELASYKDHGNELLLYISTQDKTPQQEIKVEIWQDDAFLGSRGYDSAVVRDFFGHKFTYDEEKEYGKPYHYVVYRNQYIFTVLGMELLDPDRPVTVRVYGEGRELQMEESIQLPEG